MADKAPHHDRRWMAPLAALMALAVIAIGAVWADSVTRQQVSLDDGTVCESGTPGEVFDAPRQERTRRFLERVRGR